MFSTQKVAIEGEWLTTELRISYAILIGALETFKSGPFDPQKQ
jgi:hypothetical protein